MLQTRHVPSFSIFVTKPALYAEALLSGGLIPSYIFSAAIQANKGNDFLSSPLLNLIGVCSAVAILPFMAKHLKNTFCHGNNIQHLANTWHCFFIATASSAMTNACIYSALGSMSPDLGAGILAISTMVIIGSGFKMRMNYERSQNPETQSIV